MFEETYSHSASEETLLNPRASDPASSAILIYHTFQTHANQTPCKQSSQQSRELGEVINEFTAPAVGLVLENKGCVARDHLASERTYLAYVRTSLACANAGVAFVQLFNLSTNSNDQNEGGIDLQRFARLLSVILVISGLLILVIGIGRFFMTQTALLRGVFPVARNSIAVVTFILGAALSMVFMALFTEMSGWSWSS